MGTDELRIAAATLRWNADQATTVADDLTIGRSRLLGVLAPALAQHDAATWTSPTAAASRRELRTLHDRLAQLTDELHRAASELHRRTDELHREAGRFDREAAEQDREDARADSMN